VALLLEMARSSRDDRPAAAHLDSFGEGPPGLAGSPELKVGVTVAKNRRAPLEVLRALSLDPEASVRKAVHGNKSATEEIRAQAALPGCWSAGCSGEALYKVVRYGRLGGPPRSAVKGREGADGKVDLVLAVDLGQEAAVFDLDGGGEQAPLTTMRTRPRPPECRRAARSAGEDAYSYRTHMYLFCQLLPTLTQTHSSPLQYFTSYSSKE